VRDPQGTAQEELVELSHQRLRDFVHEDEAGCSCW
jgi:hypothetical protein